MTLIQAHITSCSTPLDRPVDTAKGTIHDRQSWMIHLWDDQHRSGVGEAAPLPGFSPEGFASTGTALQALADSLKGISLSALNPSDVEHLLDQQALPASARFAAEQAILDLIGKRTHQTIAEVLGAHCPQPVASHHLIATAEEARQAVASGALALKIKVGATNWHDDLARITRIRQAAGPNVILRLDANQAWDQSTAKQALSDLASLNVAFVEEPLKDPTAAVLAALRRQAPVEIAADESVRTLDDLQALIDHDAVGVVVLKPMFIGGLQRTVAMARIAAQAGIAVVITHTLESKVGRQGAIEVAKACPRAALRVCGLGPDAPSEFIPNPLSAHGVAQPHVSALVVEAEGTCQTHTYRELAEQSAHAAGFLFAQGVTPGDRVAIKGPPGPEQIVWFHAIRWLGATAVLLNPDEPGHATDAAIIASRPDWLIGLAPARGLSNLPWQLPESAQPVAAQPWRLDDVSAIVFSSGSSGEPKAIPLTTRQLLFSAFGSAIRLGHVPQDCWLLALPIQHVGGLSIVMRTCVLGTSCLLHRRFDPDAINRAIDEERVSQLSLVPTMLSRLLDARKDRAFPAHLRFILVGGDRTSPELITRCQRVGAPLVTTWGMSETGSQIATSPIGDSRRDGVGPVIPFAAVVQSPDGRLTVTGPIAASGTLKTNDRGRVVDGWVHIDGRADRVIISGGANIAAAEVERALCDHPHIEEACVVPVQHEKWGQRPAALIVARLTSTQPSSEELIAYLKTRLARHKVPDTFTWTHGIPKNAMGKISFTDVSRLLSQAHQP